MKTISTILTILILLGSNAFAGQALKGKTGNDAEAITAVLNALKTEKADSFESISLITRINENEYRVGLRTGSYEFSSEIVYLVLPNGDVVKQSEK